MNAALVVLVALATGAASGLAVGGGSLLVAALVLLFQVKQHVAQGVVLLAFLPVALVGSVTHLLQGNVRLLRVAWLAPGAVAGALLGAGVAAAVTSDSLRRAFAVSLLAVAVYTYLKRDGGGGARPSPPGPTPGPS